MSSRTKLTLDFLSYVGTLTNNPEDLIKIKLAVEETNVSEVFRRQEQISDSASDKSIELPDSASDYIIIFSDQAISMKLNGSSDAITLNPKSSGTKTPVFFLRGTASALSLSNSSGSTANVDIIMINI